MKSNTERRLVWQPQNTKSTEVDKFRAFINARHSLRLGNYGQLHAYSVSDETHNDFWVDLFLYTGIKAEDVPNTGYLPNNPPTMHPPPVFFPGARMNFAENILSGRLASDIAIYTCGEGGAGLRSVTWGELYSLVEAVADALRSFGVTTNDRVAAVISNRLETVAMCLATLSIGAIWSSTSPDMGERGILDRLTQIRPKLVIVETGVVYNGRRRALTEKHFRCARAMKTVSNFKGYVMIDSMDDPFESVPQVSAISWTAFLERGTGKKLSFAQLPFSHPGFIVYSSGTTGPPKCIVHSAMGMLLQAKKDAVLGFDVKEGDTLLQYTTTGWIMWGMVLCGLAFKGRVVIYDGSPLVPDKLVLFRLIEQLKVTLLGTSARFLSDLCAEDIRPSEYTFNSTVGLVACYPVLTQREKEDHFDLSSLRTITSTGSVLTAQVSNWFYDDGFPPHIHLASTSGGTDLACSLVSGSPVLPVHSGEIQCMSLGMAVDVADTTAPKCTSILNTGEAGELVCTKPFPSQPLKFWGDTDGQKYRNSYFQRFGDDVWHQGDFVQLSKDTGGILMLGRSDGVLNPSGVRFGSAEVYNVVEKFPFVADSVCVGQRRLQDSDETVLLFVRTTNDTPLTQEMQERLRAAIGTAYSPRHVPRFILQTPEIPYTVNGKKVEIAVKQIVSGKKVQPSSTVANPECLKWYEQWTEIEKLVERMPKQRL